MDIRDLRYLLAVADGATLTAAADELGVSRQAVGKALRHLEAEVGAPLFERHAGELVPTRECAALVCDARTVVERFDALCAAHLHPLGSRVTEDAAGAGSLAVAMVVGGTEALPRRFFDGYLALNPGVSLDVEEMSTDSVLASVADGGFDVGIVGSHPDLLDGFETCCILPCGVWILVLRGDPLAARDRLELTDLDGRALVTPGRHNHVHRFVLQRCTQAGVAPDVRATSTDGAMLGKLTVDLGALCFGFPPWLSAPPEGMVAIELGVTGGDAFGTYVVRRPVVAGAGTPRGGRAAPSRASRLFWEMARTLADRARAADVGTAG